MRRTAAIVLCVVASGCKRPPPAPEGLEASASYVIQNFYADDLTFEAGVQGFLAWYEEEGYLLVGEQATSENTDSFVVGTLSADTLAQLPMDDEILLDADADEWGPRDLGRAPGVVSLAEMQCDWKLAEAYLVRPDQHQIFSDDFEGYERTYLTSRATYEGASADGEYDRVPDALDPFADGFDGEAYARTLLRTDSVIDPTKVITANIEAYPMHLDLRHGSYDLDGEALSAFAILTWTEAAAWGENGTNGLLQSYSVEINVERPDGVTLRMLSVWSEPKGGGIEPDSAFALNFAVNKSLAASQRLSDVCDGTVEVPDEP